MALHQCSKNLTDGWSKTAKHLLSQQTPVLVTSYTKAEAEAVMERLTVLGAHIAWQDDRNPWSGLSVFTDGFGFEKICCDNAYTIGVQGFWEPS